MGLAVSGLDVEGLGFRGSGLSGLGFRVSGGRQDLRAGASGGFGFKWNYQKVGCILTKHEQMLTHKMLFKALETTWLLQFAMLKAMIL